MAAPVGGLCLDLSLMKRIKAVHAEDMTAVVEAGVTRKALNQHLHDSGLWFTVCPFVDSIVVQPYPCRFVHLRALVAWSNLCTLAHIR